MGGPERRKELSACGNHCGGCHDFLARARDDDALREEVSRVIKKELGLDVPPERVGCDGCWGEIHTPWAAWTGCAIRTCVETKGLATCAECADFPCATYLKQFDEASNEAKNLREIREAGADDWLASREDAP